MTEATVVTINGVHFHPEQGAFHGYSDDGTVFVLSRCFAKDNNGCSRISRLTRRASSPVVNAHSSMPGRRGWPTTRSSGA